MITVAEVDRIIGDNILSLDSEKIPFDKSLGRILKEEVYADRAFPPFDRVMMDGIAISYDSWERGQRAFPVVGLQAAGDPESTIDDPTTCMEVMTGAVIPTGADSVIKYEDLEMEGDVARVRVDLEVKPKQHVHATGTDRHLGERLIKKDTIISPAEIAIFATVGKTEVLVSRLPKVAVIATGDELVEVGDAPEPHQIRKSNVYELSSGLHEIGIEASIHHFKDDKEVLRKGLAEVLEAHDILVLSGGVSKGKLDYVPEILEELGVEKLFHKVTQRPGKPFWFGRYTSGVVFALPGNPVSTFVGLKRYVIPYVYRLAGVEPKAVRAQLKEDFTFKPDLTYFLQVNLEYDDEGRLLATPAPGHGSGDLANLVDSEAFLELPQGKTEFKKGEVFRCWEFR